MVLDRSGDWTDAGAKIDVPFQSAFEQSPERCLHLERLGVNGDIHV